MTNPLCYMFQSYFLGIHCSVLTVIQHSKMDRPLPLPTHMFFAKNKKDRLLKKYF